MENFLNYIFHLCVIFLREIADFFGTTYEIVNVMIFCIFGPVIFIIMFLYILHLKRKIKLLKKDIK